MKKIQQHIKNSLALSVALLCVACSSGPNKDKLLPDEGPTTREVYDRHMAGEPLDGSGSDATRGEATRSTATHRGDTLEHPWTHSAGRRLLPFNQPASQQVARELAALQRDFQQVPNPEIVAYVYPHFSGAGHPVPGYFTAFRLYPVDHYAQNASEGHVSLTGGE